MTLAADRLADSRRSLEASLRFVILLVLSDPRLAYALLQDRWRRVLPAGALPVSETVKRTAIAVGRVGAQCPRPCKLIIGLTGARLKRWARRQVRDHADGSLTRPPSFIAFKEAADNGADRSWPAARADLPARQNASLNRAAADRLIVEPCWSIPSAERPSAASTGARSRCSGNAGRLPSDRLRVGPLPPRSQRAVRPRERSVPLVPCNARRSRHGAHVFATEPSRRARQSEAGRIR